MTAIVTAQTAAITEGPVVAPFLSTWVPPLDARRAVPKTTPSMSKIWVPASVLKQTWLTTAQWPAPGLHSLPADAMGTGRPHNRPCPLGDFRGSYTLS